jgi:hypothetical protein
MARSFRLHPTGSSGSGDLTRAGSMGLPCGMLAAAAWAALLPPACARPPATRWSGGTCPRRRLAAIRRRDRRAPRRARAREGAAPRQLAMCITKMGPSDRPLPSSIRLGQLLAPLKERPGMRMHSLSNMVCVYYTIHVARVLQYSCTQDLPPPCALEGFFKTCRGSQRLRSHASDRPCT